MGELMPDDVGEDRFLEEQVNDQVGQPAGQKDIGGVRPVRDGEDCRAQLPGKTQAKGNERKAEKDFYEALRHGVRKGSPKTWITPHAACGEAR